MIDDEVSCQTMALPSAPPDAKIFELLDAYKQRMADLGCAFCFLMILLSFQIYIGPCWYEDIFQEWYTIEDNLTLIFFIILAVDSIFIAHFYKIWGILNIIMFES